MARSQSPGDLQDFFQEFEDIKSSKKHDDEEEETTKTPDEGEQEADWLKEAGYGFLVSKFQAGKELSEDDIEAFTEALPSNHAAVVKRRVDTLNATLRKKQKYTTKIDVRNIFPQQQQQQHTVIQSQVVVEDVPANKPAQRPATLPRGLKLSSFGNGEMKSATKQKNNVSKGLKHKKPSLTSSAPYQSISLCQKSVSMTTTTETDVGKTFKSAESGTKTDLISQSELGSPIVCGYDWIYGSKDSVNMSPVDSPQRSRSSSCDTLDSKDSGLESSESILNPEHSSSRDSLETLDALSQSCFARIGSMKHIVDQVSPSSSPGSSPLLADAHTQPLLLSFRKRKSSVSKPKVPKSPGSPREEVVHPEWNRSRPPAKGPFMKNKGGYSMSGVSEEVQDNVQLGVEMLSVQQKGTSKRSSQLSPISDADITFDFNVEENGGGSGNSPKSFVSQFATSELPNFSLVQDKLGLTCIDDISDSDIAYVKNLALLELTSMFDTHNITYSRRRSKKRYKEHGVFGVPLLTLLEQDQKLKPDSRIPLVFQEIISYLVKYCLDTEGILRIPGSASRIKQLRLEMEEKFYEGKFFWAEDLTPNDVAALMKQFLRDLPIPLLTDEYIEAFAQVENLPDKKQQLHALNLLILLLPTVHRDTLNVLLEFLEKIIANSVTNKMGLNNVAMIMAPNLFMTPKVQGSNPAKNKSVWELEIKMAANTSNIMKMFIRYRTILWTVPSYLMALVRRQYELETLRKNKDKSKMKGLLSKKDKTEVYKKPAVKHETDFQDGVIRIQAPNLTKSSTAIQLDNNTTAGDIVSKFKVIQDSHAAKKGGSKHEHPDSHHKFVNDPRTFHSAGEDTFLFEKGGNIGERCLPNNTNMLALYKVNPNAEWIIKQRERFKVT